MPECFPPPPDYIATHEDALGSPEAEMIVVS